MLSKFISCEQFGFMEGRQIHEAIGVSHEGLHSLKTKKLKGVVIKIELSKAYDRVCWLYLRMLLTHLGFEIDFIWWIMACISSISFVVLINGSASPFFYAERELRQGYPSSPLLFLLVVEGLKHFLNQAKRGGGFKGIPISNVLYISHLLFVDEILIFCDGSCKDIDKLCEGLDLLQVATGIVINVHKYFVTCSNLRDVEARYLVSKLLFQVGDLDVGLKYLGF